MAKKKFSLNVPADIRNGLLFPNVVSVKLMQRSDGQTRIIEMADIKKKLPADEWQRFSSDIEINGEYKDNSFHAIVWEQDTGRL